MQQLTNVVAVLGMPMIACPGYAIGPCFWPVSYQTLVDSFQHLQRLCAWQLLGPLHELGVSGKKGELVQAVFPFKFPKYSAIGRS